MTVEEEQDWLVYCVIAKNPGLSPDDLAQYTGLDLALTRMALSRLEHALLVTRSDGAYRVASVGESILRCRLRYDKELPLVFDDGVIRMRKDGEE